MKLRLKGNLRCPIFNPFTCLPNLFILICCVGDGTFNLLWAFYPWPTSQPSIILPFICYISCINLKSGIFNLSSFSTLFGSQLGNNILEHKIQPVILWINHCSARGSLFWFSFIWKLTGHVKCRDSAVRWNSLGFSNSAVGSKFFDLSQFTHL